MQELLIVAGAHLLAVMSPGPDFAMVLKMALVNGRSSALWGSLGVALGILVHVLYSIIGIALVISQSIVLFNTIKLLGAAYLVWIGVKALRSKPASSSEDPLVSQQPEAVGMQPLEALRVGFVTNVLNPKATLFFLSLFTQVIGASTPLWLKTAYGIEMALATFAWFAVVSIVMTRPLVQKRFIKIKHHVDRVFGGLLVALGLRVALGDR